MAISFESFEKQLERIKALDSKLQQGITDVVQQNPFIEDGQGVAKGWVYELITEHLYTLFMAVNEEAAYKPLIPDMEEAIKEYEKNKNKDPQIFYEDPRKHEDDYVLQDFLDYYYYECDCGGEIVTTDKKVYDLKDTKSLYEYLLTL